jgi:hypothetical protein
LSLSLLGTRSQISALKLRERHGIHEKIELIELSEKGVRFAPLQAFLLPLLQDD